MKIQMPSRGVSAQRWTPAQRAAVLLMIASAVLVVVSLAIIGWGIAQWVTS